MNNLILKKRHFLGLLGDVALAGAKAHQKPLLVFWGQTVPEKSKENNLPLQCLHPYNFLPLSFDCQACLQDLYSGLRMYFKSPHHSVQFGTKHVCCYLGTSVGEIWVERPALPSLSHLKPRLPNGSSHCTPGIVLSLGAFVHLLIIQCEKPMCLYKCACKYIFFRIMYLF